MFYLYIYNINIGNDFVFFTRGNSNRKKKFNIILKKTACKNGAETTMCTTWGSVFFSLLRGSCLYFIYTSFSHSFVCSSWFYSIMLCCFSICSLPCFSFKKSWKNSRCLIFVDREGEKKSLLETMEHRDKRINNNKCNRIKRTFQPKIWIDMKNGREKKKKENTQHDGGSCCCGFHSRVLCFLYFFPHRLGGRADVTTRPSVRLFKVIHEQKVYTQQQHSRFFSPFFSCPQTYFFCWHCWHC